MFSFKKATSKNWKYYKELINQLSPIDNEYKGGWIRKGWADKQIILLKNDKLKRHVGTIAYFVEHKVSHSNRPCLHIEDLVVDKEFRAQGLGKMLIDEVLQRTKVYNCYKVILNCSKENIGFYEKCGFRPVGIEMRLDLGE